MGVGAGGQGGSSRLLMAAGAMVVALMLVITIVAAGVVVAAAIAGMESPEAWSRWANVGESFGVLDSLLSGLAFAALIVTLWIQFRELRVQQSELRLQRDAIERSSEELRRSAEASMRMLHFELVRMSIDDPALADVWPHPPAAADPADRRQLIYANLIFQHVALAMTVAGDSDEAVRRQLRHLLTSPVMRRYWAAAAAERAAMVIDGTEDARIARLGDEVYRDLDRGAAA
ncbi:DUF6082 family protein [Phytohabitans rumicis]|uniref:Uncharacterized protein n=1 Tax=Phytohabitans rumicis TaxID=1076125 RepID=A0A6V8LEW4_9ACTN|nr:DUF6082 family protein [Phytohabitans rumicis]GFJ92587.1 hypothetical protein Prum_062290 [Phytohabitans rumicis]